MFFSVKTIVLVGIYNQQFKGTILFMVFDFQGKVYASGIELGDECVEFTGRRKIPLYGWKSRRKTKRTFKISE